MEESKICKACKVYFSKSRGEKCAFSSKSRGKDVCGIGTGVRDYSLLRLVVIPTFVPKAPFWSSKPVIKKGDACSTSFSCLHKHGEYLWASSQYPPHLHNQKGSPSASFLIPSFSLQRKVRDSNPRYADAYTAFRVRLFRPLRQLSISCVVALQNKSKLFFWARS